MKAKEIKIKSKSAMKKLLQDERGVSTVMGFVLIMGIVLSASTIYFSSQVPNWTKDFEALHTADVADDFAEQKSLIDGIVLNKGESELAGGATPLKMAPDKVPILGMSPSGSNLIFNHQDEKIEIVVPTGGGGSGETKTWEQNATTGFPYKDAYHVDNSSNVTLARQTVECADEELVDTTVQWGGEYCFNNLTLSNSIIYVSPVTGTLKIYATNITIDYDSKIIADGVGFSGGAGGSGANENGTNGVGVESGMGKGGDAGIKGYGGGGAGYGALGGNGGETGGGAGGDAYDPNPQTIEMGSGGGGGGATSQGDDGGDGGNGGGLIFLDAEQINIAGTISANGEKGVNADPKGGGGGGGSGGGIMIKGKDVTILGTLSAKGGDGGESKAGGTGGGGGAGGTIKIFYGTINEVGESYLVDHGDGGEDNGNDGNDGPLPAKQQIPYTSSTPYVEDGYFISVVNDTTSDSTRYGEMTWNATLDENTNIVMKVRTDMFEDMRASPDWEYCPAVPNGSDVSGLSSVSDGHRYVQYCAELSTEDTATTPVLHWVKINYSLSAESPVVATSSGSIKFNSNYLYYPNQQIVYEHGAVIKYQSEGGFMLQSPPITITNASGIPTLRITLVNLTGANRSYSGATSTSVKNTYKSYNLLVDNLKYPNLAINLTTEYPSVWGKWFNKTLEETTLTTPYHYNVSVNDAAKTVSVEFYGYVDGVELYLEKTTVEVEI